MSANISIIGNLGKTPETKITDNGTLVASFSMASNSFRNNAEGRVEKTDWFRVTAFGKQAETLAVRAKRQPFVCTGTPDLQPVGRSERIAAGGCGDRAAGVPVPVGPPR